MSICQQFRTKQYRGEFRITRPDKSNAKWERQVSTEISAYHSAASSHAPHLDVARLSSSGWKILAPPLPCPLIL
jgi:hypothetical protein